MAKNAAATAAKWKRNASNALADYKEGVQNTTVDPMAEAVKNLDKAAQNYQESISSGYMKRRLESVTKNDWIKLTLEKGAARYTGGISASEGKMAEFLADFLPFQESVTQKVLAMPSLTLEDNISRMVEQVRGTSAYKNRR